MNRTNHVRLGLAACLIGFVLWGVTPTIAQTADCVWTGTQSTEFSATGNWSSCNGDNGTEPPSDIDTVTVQNRDNDPIIASDTTIGTLTIRSNGVLRVEAGAVLTVGNLDWQQGALRGEGRTVVNKMTLNGSSNKTLNGHTLDNVGTATWNDGVLVLRDGAIWNNLAGAVLNILTNRALLTGSGENPVVFNNMGTIQKSAGNASEFAVPLNNTGTVDAQRDIQFTAGGTNSGIFDIGANGSIQLEGIHTLESSGTVTGTGALIVTSQGTQVMVQPSEALSRTVNNTGNTTVNTTANNTFTIPNLTFTRGLIDVALELTVGTLNWTLGTIRGEGRTTINEMNLDNSTNKTIHAHTLENAGTTTWNDGVLVLRDGAILNNLEGALFDIRTNRVLFTGSGDNPVAFNNLGTVRKSAGNTNEIDVVFNNIGTVEVQRSMDLSAGGTSSGVFTISSGQTLQIEENYTLNSSALVTGTGRLVITQQGTRLTIQPSSESARTVNDTTNDTASISNLAINNGVLDADSDVTIDDLSWTFGTITGDGVTTVNDMTMTGTNLKTLNDHTLKNMGTATWEDGSIVLRDGAVFDNLDGGVFDFQGNDSMFIGTGDNPVKFANAGTVIKSVGTSSRIQVPFENSGIVDAQTNRISFEEGYTQLDGVTHIDGGTIAGTLDIFGGILSGDGTFDGTVNNAGNFSPGQTDSSLGFVSITGNYQQDTAGTLTVELSDSGGADFVSVFGRSSLDGEIVVDSIDDFVPAADQFFTVIAHNVGEGAFMTVTSEIPDRDFAVESGPTSTFLTTEIVTPTPDILVPVTPTFELSAKPSIFLDSDIFLDLDSPNTAQISTTAPVIDRFDLILESDPTEVGALNSNWVISVVPTVTVDITTFLATIFSNVNGIDFPTVIISVPETFTVTPQLVLTAPLELPPDTVISVTEKFNFTTTIHSTYTNQISVTVDTDDIDRIDTAITSTFFITFGWNRLDRLDATLIYSVPPGLKKVIIFSDTTIISVTNRISFGLVIPPQVPVDPVVPDPVDPNPVDPEPIKLGRQQIFAGQFFDERVGRSIDSGNFVGNSSPTRGTRNDAHSDVLIWSNHKVQVYYNRGNGVSQTPDFTVPTFRHVFKTGAANAGDVDGNGFDDLVIINSERFGSIAIFYSDGTALAETPGTVITSQRSDGERIGGIAGSAGDVNGDGFDDVFVGIHNMFGGDGKLFIYHGSADGITATRQPEADTIIQGEGKRERFGFPTASAGDVNNDGFDDLIVAAPFHVEDDSQGKIYLYLGSADGLSEIPAFTFLGEGPRDALGLGDVGSAGDVNGDGFGDILFSSHSSDVNGHQRGKVYVLHGDDSADGIAGNDVGSATIAQGPDLSVVAFSEVGDLTSPNLGVSSAGIGDVNGDGFDDIAVGGMFDHRVRQNLGAVYVYPGGPDGLDKEGVFLIEGEYRQDRFGDVIRRAGDVNGDGKADMLVSSSRHDDGALEAGKVYVYAGQQDDTILTPPLGPEPFIVSFFPKRITAGATDTRFTMFLREHNNTLVARLNGEHIETRPARHTIRFTIPADKLADPGTVLFDVINTATGAVSSRPVSLTITPPRVGVSEIESPISSVDTAQKTQLDIVWTHPISGWRTIDTFDVQISDGERSPLWVRYTEIREETPARQELVDVSTFSLLNDEGEVEVSGQVGSDGVIETNAVKVYLAESSVVGTGEGSPQKAMRMVVMAEFKDDAAIPAAENTFSILTLPTDDNGESQGQEVLGEVTIVGEEWPLYLPLIRR
ncbi:MAG: FG-GAP-like repeat-containing protein [Chloroflexota bacterium]